MREEKPTSICFNSYTCLDLSEDQAQLSTKDDEVIVVYGEITTDTNQIINSVLFYNTGITQIKKASIHKLETTHHLQSYPNIKNLLFIGLVEVDDNINPNKLVATFKNHLIRKNVREVNTIWEKSIKTISKFNDNLGIVFNHLSIGEKTYLIAGNHFTDRYEYRFNVDIK